MYTTVRGAQGTTVLGLLLRQPLATLWEKKDLQKHHKELQKSRLRYHRGLNNLNRVLGPIIL